MDAGMRYADSRTYTMMKKPIFMPRWLAAAYVAFALATPLCAGAQQRMPSDVVKDVNESYRLLVNTPYRKVEAQSLLDAARSALIEATHKRGAKVTVPDMRVLTDPEATMSLLDQSIETVADAAHGSATEYAYAAIVGMAKSIEDRWTVFMKPDEFKAFNDALDPQKISGIGVLIEQDPVTQLVRTSYVVPGTPADRAGLQTGDTFVAIDGTSTKGISQESASKLLRGKAGSVVHIDVARGDVSTAHDVAITRSEVQPPTVIYKMLPGNVGYMYVIAFGRATPFEFDMGLARLKNAGARALVLDLRNDGGGYVDSALEISSRFIANKALVTVEQRGTAAQTIRAEDDTRINVPVTVLVNNYTASASEITAGALQDDGIGLLVGTKTFGKGVMQTLTPLSDGSAIKITTAHYLTPHGHDINLRGIQPDLHIDENQHASFGELGKDAQLRAALVLLQKKIADAAKP